MSQDFFTGSCRTLWIQQPLVLKTASSNSISEFVHANINIQVSSSDLNYIKNMYFVLREKKNPQNFPCNNYTSVHVCSSTSSKNKGRQKRFYTKPRSRKKKVCKHKCLNIKMAAPMCFNFLISIKKIISFSSEAVWANSLLEL